MYSIKLQDFENRDKINSVVTMVIRFVPCLVLI